MAAKKKAKLKKSKKSATRKPSRKKPVKKKAAAKKPRRTPKMPKPIGKVTHFFNHISVAIVKFNKKVTAGARLAFRGGEVDFEQEAKSMQYEHEPIKAAPKGKEVGIKVKKRVHEGVLVYPAE